MPVTLDITDDIALITMDDGKANAASHTLLEALDASLSEAEARAKAVVLAGRPGRFCAGFDLSVMQAGDPEAIQTLVARGGRMVHRLYGFPKPLIAAATGHGIALGAIWLMACDTRIGARGAYKFGLNETAIGMALPVFGLALAEARLAPTHLTAAVVQAFMYEPDGAVAAGYLDLLTDEDKVVETALAVAGQLGALPGNAYVANKLAIRRPTLDVVAASLGG